MEVHASLIPAFVVEPRMFHECSERNTTIDRRFVARVVDEVDGTRFGDEVESGDVCDEEEGTKELDEVEMEGSNRFDDLLWTETKELDE